MNEEENVGFFSLCWNKDKALLGEVFNQVEHL